MKDEIEEGYQCEKCEKEFDEEDLYGCDECGKFRQLYRYNTTNSCLCAVCFVKNINRYGIMTDEERDLLVIIALEACEGE